MRKARENIDPDLLEKARQAIAHQVLKDNGAKDKQSGVYPQKDNRNDKDEDSEILIDRKKNLRTIITFLEEIDSGTSLHKSIQQNLRAYLNENPKEFN